MYKDLHFKNTNVLNKNQFTIWNHFNIVMSKFKSVTKQNYNWIKTSSYCLISIFKFPHIT